MSCVLTGIIYNDPLPFKIIQSGYITIIHLSIGGQWWGNWGKKLSRVESGVPDIYVAFRFDTKLTIQGQPAELLE